MRATYLLSALLACSVAAKDAKDAFKRVDNVLGSRNVGKQQAAAPRHEQLQKRASPFLNDATQSNRPPIMGFSNR